MPGLTGSMSDTLPTQLSSNTINARILLPLIILNYRMRPQGVDIILPAVHQHRSVFETRVMYGKRKSTNGRYVRDNINDGSRWNHSQARVPRAAVCPHLRQVLPMRFGYCKWQAVKGLNQTEHPVDHSECLERKPETGFFRKEIHSHSPTTSFSSPGLEAWTMFFRVCGLEYLQLCVSRS